MCGAQLGSGHRFCSHCGAPRWPAAHLLSAVPPPPGPGTPAIGARPTGSGRPGLGLLPWFYAAGAVYLLVLDTQLLAYYLSPVWREQQLQLLAHQGYPPPFRSLVLALTGVIFIGLFSGAASAHAMAFYGLRRLRRWGWLAAVLIAGLWSLLVVGLPVLLRLTSRNVRQAYGVD